MKLSSLLCALLLGTALPVLAGQAGTTAADWSMNASVIQACTCPVLCQAVVDREALGDEGTYLDPPHYCRFNSAFRVNYGHSGSVKLDGTKFWISGDFGSDPSKGRAEWAILTFDRATSQAQRNALGEIITRLMPAKWQMLTVAEGDIQWTPGREVAWATLDGGETAEIRLKRFQGITREPVVVRNLRYFGASRNDGFALMPNVIETLRKGDKAFESRGTCGFTVTVDIDSKAAPATGAAY
jgi:hypothetical protein